MIGNAFGVTTLLFIFILSLLCPGFAREATRRAGRFPQQKFDVGVDTAQHDIKWGFM
ncbi:hypothetical protein [Desulfallas thermosapovorans]|uniref:hypothetical protein n=1 Tax=Desulfallas thermosapovorans TaxID=58137 RepID=UPI0014124BC3|nr:hypothetical protein [Desulfallas thermosapovorans]